MDTCSYLQRKFCCILLSFLTKRKKKHVLIVSFKTLILLNLDFSAEPLRTWCCNCGNERSKLNIYQQVIQLVVCLDFTLLIKIKNLCNLAIVEEFVYVLIGECKFRCESAGRGRVYRRYTIKLLRGVGLLYALLCVKFTIPYLYVNVCVFYIYVLLD